MDLRQASYHIYIFILKNKTYLFFGGGTHYSYAAPVGAMISHPGFICRPARTMYRIKNKKEEITAIEEKVKEMKRSRGLVRNKGKVGISCQRESNR